MKRSWYAAPYALWMLLFAVVPLLFVCWYAFTTPDGHFTLANFQEFSKPRYLGIIVRSLKLALGICVDDVHDRFCRSKAHLSVDESASRKLTRVSNPDAGHAETSQYLLLYGRRTVA